MFDDLKKQSGPEKSGPHFNTDRSQSVDAILTHLHECKELEERKLALQTIARLGLTFSPQVVLFTRYALERGIEDDSILAILTQARDRNGWSPDLSNLLRSEPTLEQIDSNQGREAWMKITSLASPEEQLRIVWHVAKFSRIPVGSEILSLIETQPLSWVGDVMVGLVLRSTDPEASLKALNRFKNEPVTLNCAEAFYSDILKGNFGFDRAEAAFHVLHEIMIPQQHAIRKNATILELANSYLKTINFALTSKFSEIAAINLLKPSVVPKPIITNGDISVKSRPSETETSTFAPKPSGAAAELEAIRAGKPATKLRSYIKTVEFILQHGTIKEHDSLFKFAVDHVQRSPNKSSPLCKALSKLAHNASYREMLTESLERSKRQTFRFSTTNVEHDFYSLAYFGQSVSPPLTPTMLLPRRYFPDFSLFDGSGFQFGNLAKNDEFIHVKIPEGWSARFIGVTLILFDQNDDPGVRVIAKNGKFVMEHVDYPKSCRRQDPPPMRTFDRSQNGYRFIDASYLARSPSGTWEVVAVHHRESGHNAFAMLRIGKDGASYRMGINKPIHINIEDLNERIIMRLATQDEANLYRSRDIDLKILRRTWPFFADRINYKEKLDASKFADSDTTSLLAHTHAIVVEHSKEEKTESQKDQHRDQEQIKIELWNSLYFEISNYNRLLDQEHARFDREIERARRADKREQQQQRNEQSFGHSM